MSEEKEDILEGMEVAEFNQHIYPYNWKFDSIMELEQFFTYHKLIGRCRVSQEIVLEWKLNHKMLLLDDKVYGLNFKLFDEGVYLVSCVEVQGYDKKEER